MVSLIVESVIVVVFIIVLIVMVVFAIPHCRNMHDILLHGTPEALISSSAVVQEGHPEDY